MKKEKDLLIEPQLSDGKLLDKPQKGNLLPEKPHKPLIDGNKKVKKRKEIL